MAYASLISEEIWNGEVEESEMTWGDRLQAKVLGENIERFRQVCLVLLTQRFGTLPEAARLRLEAIHSMGGLERLSKRIFIASSLAELDLA